MIIEVGTEAARWAFLDENLANLVKKRTRRRDLVLQIATKADPGKIRGFLPQAAQAGGGIGSRSSDESVPRLVLPPVYRS
jgi:hypothetical protein